MLAYFLAILVAITSLSLYINAFIRPKIHRKDDFLWSGLGLFYALVLWICAGRITGSVLLGQCAGVAVAIAFIWENSKLRQALIAESQSNQALEGFSVLTFIAQLLAKVSQLGKKKPVVTTSPPEKPSETITTPPEEKEEISSTVASTTKEETQIKNQPTETEIKAYREEVIRDTIEEVTTPSQLEKDIAISDEGKEEEKIDTTSEDEEIEIDNADTTPDNETEKAENKPKINLIGRIRNIFRKSPAETSSKSVNDELPESLLDEIDDLEEEIDPESTAVEVEEAIANLDVTESSQEEEKDNQEVSEISQESDGEKAIEEELISDSQEEANEDIKDKSVVVEEEKENDVEEGESKITEENTEVMEENVKIESEIETTVTSQAENLVVEEQISPKTDTQEEEKEKEIPPEDTIESLDDLFPDKRN
ncbi:Ycf66 family protein [Cyanobacterium aponinum AL20118]|uniref:Ycf66 family protein n=1 Tax=Cyanobacterium aponinum AL20115 TaxID=3090662 RepID=A0AAF0ZBL9_9CHRO|nr:Ycf66 family protein [Cyanobacterium aponinum]WPF89256.1 Ycf66 family protein [Cyanobacterium aponinum AL20115]